MSNISSKRPMKGTLSDENDKFVNGNIRDSGPQVQNVKTARVYIFGDADLDEEELINDDLETYELRSRGKSRDSRLKPNAKPISENGRESPLVSIERPILEGETLQKIAVKYCCEVSVVKGFDLRILSRGPLV